jgi:hypothetical protein
LCSDCFLVVVDDHVRELTDSVALGVAREEARHAINAVQNVDATLARVRQFVEHTYTTRIFPSAMSDMYVKNFNKIDRFNRFVRAVRLKFRANKRVLRLIAFIVACAVTNAWIKKQSMTNTKTYKIEEKSHRESLKGDLRLFVQDLAEELAKDLENAPTGEHTRRG